MTLLFALTGCLPYDGLVPDEPQVQRAAYVDCSVSALSEIDRGAGYVPYFERVQEHDEWGNVVYDRIQVSGGQAFYQIDAEYRGQWLDRYEETDGLERPNNPTVRLDERDWDGVFLLESRSTRDGVTLVTTYTNDGVLPYTASEHDDDGDGVPDGESTFTWDGGHVVAVDTDNGMNGTIDETRRLDYDAEGRVVRDDAETLTQFLYARYEWAGPHDNLVSYTEESGVIDGASSTYAQSLVWDDGWTSSSTEQSQDGTVIEVNEATYDGEGRMLTNTREFPGQNVAPTREVWTWNCP